MKRAATVVFIFSVIMAASGSAEASDFYQELAGHWSPDLYQDTGYFPEGDYITAFDVDGDWIGRNQLEGLRAGRFEPYPAYLYFSVVESETHYFIIYDVYHPFDYDRPWARKVPGAFHENDTESVMVVVAKAPSLPYGRFRLMETTPHGYFRYYTNDPRLKLNFFKPAERVSLRDGSHPEIYIQQGGHGPYALHARGNGFTIRHGFHNDVGVVYRYKGVAESPAGPNDRDVGYDLIGETSARGFWTHRCDHGAFDGYRPYVPPEGRPGVPRHLLCDGLLPASLDGDTSGDSTGVDSAGLFYGRNGSYRGALGTRGVFGFDPAWAMARHWKFHEPYSMDYIYNPYLGIGH